MKILIHTPFGKDGQHLHSVLTAEGYECHVCASLEELSLRVEENVDVILTTEEVLEGKNLVVLVNELKNQPEWSTIPIIVFYTPYTGQLTIGPKEEEPIRRITELHFIPRPVSSLLLLNAIRSAFRDRNRQYKVRDLLQELQQDISRRQDYEKQLSCKVNELNEERHLREQFVATLTHDLRTPLTSAKMSAELLARKAEDPVSVQKLAGRVSMSIDRADRMIRDLLDANRIKAGELVHLELESLDLVHVVKDSLDELSSVYGDWFKLKADGAIQGFWSKEALRRIVENLASNAVKYGLQHSWVTLTVIKFENQEAEIAVHNFGPPIPPSDKDLVFDSFKRVESSNHRKQKGWGLGLTLVKGLTEAHGGKVTFESTHTNGTTFFVRIPMDARSVNVNKADS